MTSFTQKLAYHSNQFPPPVFTSPTRSHNTNYNIQCDSDILDHIYTDTFLPSPQGA